VERPLCILHGGTPGWQATGSCSLKSSTHGDAVQSGSNTVNLASAPKQGRRHLAWPWSCHDQSCARAVHAVRRSGLSPTAAPQHLAARPHAEDAACTCLQHDIPDMSLLWFTWSRLALHCEHLFCRVYVSRRQPIARTYCKVGADDAAAVQRVERNLLRMPGFSRIGPVKDISRSTFS